MDLNEALIRAGMTAYQLSKKSKVSQTQISRIRNGTTAFEDIKVKNGVALADALNVDIHELIEEKKEV